MPTTTQLVISGLSRPGVMAQVTKEVADLLTKARINIKCGYCTPSREGKRAIVVLTVSNTARALTILRDQSLDEF